MYSITIHLQIRAFDPTVNTPNTEEYVNNYSEKIAFSKIGLYFASQENLTIGEAFNVETLTLEDAIDRYIYSIADDIYLYDRN